MKTFAISTFGISAFIFFIFLNIYFYYFDGFLNCQSKTEKYCGNDNKKCNPREGLPYYIIERLNINDYNLEYE